MCLIFWSSDYVPRDKIIFLTIAAASHYKVSTIWVTFTLWGHTWKCKIWIFLVVINEHDQKKPLASRCWSSQKKGKKLLGLETEAKSPGTLPRQGAWCTWGEFCFSFTCSVVSCSVNIISFDICWWGLYTANLLPLVTTLNRTCESGLLPPPS